MNTRRYVTGLDDPIIMDHIEWWWPGVPSPYVVCTLGSIGFAVFAATIIPFSRPRQKVPAVAEPTAGASRHVASPAEA